ncbi:hypothetical protein [Streptomyces viridochromogenes]|nr:hypothetical protein [Streptomyces viridochromogenes]
MQRRIRTVLTSAMVTALAAITMGLAPSSAGAAGNTPAGSTAVAHRTTGIVTAEEARQAPLTKAQMRNAVTGKQAKTDSVAAALNCSYTYVCGQGANGNRFDYTKCDTVYTLPNLVGWGPINNNQTPGTWAHFYDVNGYWLFSINAPVQAELDWTPVWYAIAC